jgi:hypothetical protein
MSTHYAQGSGKKEARIVLMMTVFKPVVKMGRTSSRGSRIDKGKQGWQPQGHEGTIPSIALIIPWDEPKARAAIAPA